MTDTPCWPPHKCGMHLTHNQHRDYYETVAQYLANLEVVAGEIREDQWANPGERERAIEADELWELQWYPRTPVCFIHVFAASFEALMDGVKAQGES